MIQSYENDVFKKKVNFNQNFGELDWANNNKGHEVHHENFKTHEKSFTQTFSSHPDSINVNMLMHDNVILTKKTQSLEIELEKLKEKKYILNLENDNLKSIINTFLSRLTILLLHNSKNNIEFKNNHEGDAYFKYLTEFFIDIERAISKILLKTNSNSKKQLPVAPISPHSTKKPIIINEENFSNNTKQKKKLKIAEDPLPDGVIISENKDGEAEVEFNDEDSVEEEVGAQRGCDISEESGDYLKLKDLILKVEVAPACLIEPVVNEDMLYNELTESSRSRKKNVLTSESKVKFKEGIAKTELQKKLIADNKSEKLKKSQEETVIFNHDEVPLNLHKRDSFSKKSCSKSKGKTSTASYVTQKESELIERLCQKKECNHNYEHFYGNLFPDKK